jgi:hypothetical protein
MTPQQEKANQFITMVQTAVLAKYISDPGDGSSPMSRPMWSIVDMEHAFVVASTIPPDITAREAAEAFVRWLFHVPPEGDDEIILQILLRDEDEQT